jgi:hypothetical protein
MKHLLSGVAIVAALALAAPVSAQRTGPGPGAPGPNQPVPGGPGPSSPLSNLPASPSRDLPYPASASPPPAGAMPSGAMESTSAAPPMHRHARHGAHAHGKMAMRHGHGRATPVSANTSADRLNADELTRLQAGNTSNPPPAALPYGAPSAGGAPR